MGLLIIPQDIHNEIMFYVNECSTEVSGMGRVTITPTGDYLVNKIYLLPQEVGAAHTDIDAEAICKLMLDTMEDPGDLLYWWHSHVNMQAFWSGTDLATIKTMGKNGLCVASVFNKKGESKHAACYTITNNYTKAEELVCHESIQCMFGIPATDEQKDYWRMALKANLRERPAVTVSYRTPDYEADYYGNYYGVTEMTRKAWDRPLLSHGYDESEYGILGYGADIEAKALGIPVEQFKKIVSGNDGRAYKNLEYKLEQLLEKGAFYE